MFSDGYRIVYRRLSNLSNNPEYNEDTYTLDEEFQWRRLENEISWDYNSQDKKSISISFNFEFNFDSQGVLFAFCYPWSYHKNRAFLNYIESKIPKEIYFHREVLTYSKEKRKVELLTISDHSGRSKVREPHMKNLFPENNKNPRPFTFSKDKLVIFISARVHPGETPSSYLLNGIIKLLVNSDDPRAKLLRKFFVFKIVPIINVDGVYRGHYRYDTNCLNMNRHYEFPQIKCQPEIYSLVKIFVHYSREYKVKYYFDLHAHVQSKGLFVFGNSLDFLNQVENCLLPMITQINSQYLLYENCIFNEKSMKTKEKGDMNSKQGTGRVHFNKLTGIVHSYTVEASYFRSYFVNTIPSIVCNDQKLLEFRNILEDISLSLDILDLDSKSKLNYIYEESLDKDLDLDMLSPKSYEKMGIALVISIMDYEGINPYSRLFTSEFQSLFNLRSHVSNKLLNEDDKYKRSLANHSFNKDINSFKKTLSIFEKLSSFFHKSENTFKKAQQPKISEKLNKILPKIILPANEVKNFSTQRNTKITKIAKINSLQKENFVKIFNIGFKTTSRVLNLSNREDQKRFNSKLSK